MATSGSMFTAMALFTCFTCLVATLLHIIAYATPYWLVSNGDSVFERIGWHEVCFKNCHHPYCPGGDPDIIYNGCYVWTFNDYILTDLMFQELVSWLFPPWFKASMNIFIINLVLTLVLSILLIVCSCYATTERYTVESPFIKDVKALVIIFVSLPLLIVACLLNITGICIFSANAPRRDYMPMAQKNHFGFSYWLDIAVCVLLSIASFTAFLAAIAKTLHIQGPRDPNYSEDMMLGRVAKL